MKNAIIWFMVMVLAIPATAGWFKENKPREIKPIHGYKETKTLETNDWDTAVEMSKRPPRNEVAIEYLNYNSISTMTNVWMNIGVAYYNHTQEPCTKEHLSDYPKTQTSVRGVQYKIVTEYYKDGELVATILTYSYPHKKLTVTTVTSVKKEEAVTTVIEDTKDGNL